MGFDVTKVTNEIIEFIRNYYHENNMTGVVIGLSGGKDSAVCLALMVKAIGSENVLALCLPANSKRNDKTDAKKIAKLYNVELKEFDLSHYASNFINDMKDKNKVSDNDLIDAEINIKPRLRMLTLYSYATMMNRKTI